MKQQISIIILFCLIHSWNCQEQVELNDRPIIGILSQEISYHLNTKYPDLYHSFIAASYVKFVESGGGRVVPIWIGRDREYYENILNSLNGVLFPGGATWFNQSDGYADAGRIIYDLAIEMNNNGNYLPIWGTCLGFELLTYLSVEPELAEHRAHCSSDRQALALEFVQGYQESRMFGAAGEETNRILSTELVTSNFHNYCITPDNFTEIGLDKQWTMMSINRDFNNLTFISTIEHKFYPFYGVQFHPEKNLFEWIPNRNISHTANSIRVSQYFGRFFINECRKNFNQFNSTDEEGRHLIYNFQTTYTHLVNSIYEECYMFTEHQDYPTRSNNSSNHRLNLSISLRILWTVVFLMVGKKLLCS